MAKLYYYKRPPLIEPHLQNVVIFNSIASVEIVIISSITVLLAFTKHDYY